ncbi:uncharacterized protein LOC110724998 [Chenopodium quinoa]|uniref:uncharacterized protein LOC110724998 n=1 Tax=Chenopodium quinoa TaxID=63459 RepID=UPI000B799946|nr:uncharacterized protein LOC110724998 [Chenopodium quinoa]
MQIENALWDLGAIVSLMPYSVYQRLELRELLPTNITLQLVDRSIKLPKGKVEVVPLRVGKFVILVDFVVIEMDEDASIPITVIEFDLNDSMKYPSYSLENCMFIDSLDHAVSSMHEKFLTSNYALENVLLNKEMIGTPSKEMVLYEDVLNGGLEGMFKRKCV